MTAGLHGANVTKDILISRGLYDHVNSFEGIASPGDWKELREHDLIISYFGSTTATIPKPEIYGFSKLPDCLLTHQEIDDKTSGRLFSAVAYKQGATRSVAGTDKVYALVYDFDDVPAGFNPQRFLNALPGVPMIVYSSFSHTPEKPKYRVVLPLAWHIPPAHYKEVWTVVAGLFPLKSDPAPSAASSIFYLPACKPGAERVMLTQEIVDGGLWEAPFDWITFLQSAKVKPEKPAPVRKAHVTDETPDSILICERCKTMGYALEVGGDIPEPWWFATLKVAAACQPDISVELSNGYRGFNQNELDHKMQRIADEEIKPALCDSFKRHSDLCAGCEWNGLIGSPVALGFARLPSKRRRAGVAS